MPRNKPRKQKQKQVINLHDLQKTTTSTTTSVTVNKYGYDDEITQEISLPVAPRHTRVNYDPERIFEDGPYTIQVQTLPYDIDEETLRNFFQLLDDSEIESVTIPRGDDDRDRFQGLGYITVRTKEALSAALSRDNEPLQNKQQQNQTGQRQGQTRLEIEYKDKWGCWAANTNSNSRNRREKRGNYNSDKKDNTLGNWRDKKPEGNSSFGDRDRRPGRSFGRSDDFNRDKFGSTSRDRDEPVIRRKLNLKPRTLPVVEVEVVKEVEIKREDKVAVRSNKPKINPFGDAKAINEDKIKEAEERAERKLEQQMGLGPDRQTNTSPRRFGSTDVRNDKDYDELSRRRKSSFDDRYDRNYDRRDDRRDNYNSRDGRRDDYDDRRDGRRDYDDRGRNDDYDRRDDDRRYGRRDDYDRRDDYCRRDGNDRRDDYGRGRDQHDNFQDRRDGGYRNDDRRYNDRNYNNRDDDFRRGDRSYERIDDRRYNDQRDDSGYRGNRPLSPERDPPRERKKLQLKKRSEALPQPTQNTSSNSKIFGNAKPVDIELQKKKDLEIEERLNKERVPVRRDGDRDDRRGDNNRRISIEPRDKVIIERNKDKNEETIKTERPKRIPKPKIFEQPKSNFEISNSKFGNLKMDSEGGSNSEDESDYDDSEESQIDENHQISQEV